MNTDLVTDTSPQPTTIGPHLFLCAGEWEHNGPDDSDWYVVVYNSRTNELERILTGTTRCAFPPGSPIPGMGPMTPEMAARARLVLVEKNIRRMTHEETMRVEQPKIETLTRGTRVRFVEAHHCAKKEASVEQVDCEKCGGSGSWINPYKVADKRPCFACKSTGKVNRTTRTKVTETTSKTITRGKNKGQVVTKAAPVWEEIDAGATGEVLAQATFGQFYRNGYNTPGRTNTTVYVRLDDGREVQTPASKLRLDCERPSDKTIRTYIEETTPLPDGTLFNAYYRGFETSSRCL